MKSKALFLDRDGIINVDHGYVSKIEDFEFVEGIFDLVRLFSDARYLVFVVTNQSGIGRGYYSGKDFDTLTEWMISGFREKGIFIEKVYHCPHAPEENCLCRKPEIGMIQKAVNAYDIDLPGSWMIGDKQSDMDLAANAGVGHSIYIGKGKIQNSTYAFNSIMACKSYLEKNQDIIRL